MSSASSWFIPRDRDYAAESSAVTAPVSQPTRSHPLSRLPLPSSSADDDLTSSQSVLDSAPLVANPLMDDPLSALTGGPSTASSSSSSSFERSFGEGESSIDPENNTDSFVSWDSKKSSIMLRYTTNKSIPVVAKFMAETTVPKGAPSGAPGAAPATQNEKVKSRLEQLDDTEEGMERKVIMLNQKEYVAHIETLNDDLKQAWAKDEKVKAIKIAIQASKFLTDTSVPQFYPSMFVLVTEVLDTFGKLVYGRILSRANELEGRPLPDDFLPDRVHAEARETCRNWFYKIASIRELVPRIYVELAILKSYRFIADPADYAAILARLVAIVRGIGDPLVAAYARTYLARCGVAVAPKTTEYLIANYNDLLLTYRPQLTGAPLAAELGAKNLAAADYYDLFSPAYDWVLQCAGHGAGKDAFFGVMDRYIKHCGAAIVLHHIISSFKPSLISQYAGKIAELLKTADYASYPKYRVYSAFSVTLVMHPPPQKDRLALLNDLWKVARKIEDVREFMEVASTFVDFPLKYFTQREVNTVLADVRKRVTADRAHEGLLPQINALVHRVLSSLPFEKVLQMDSFLPLVDLFPSQSDIARSLLGAYCASPEPTADPFMIHSLFDCAKTLHDSITHASTEDDRRVVTALLCKFVHHVEFGLDFEKHLSFLVDCRRDLTGIDAVKGRVANAACTLAMKTLRVVRGKHSAKTMAFVKACMAYTFITIPSIEDVFSRLSLYTLAGQVALANGLIGQAEACLKGAITVIPEVPLLLEEEHSQIKTTDKHLTAAVESLVAALVAVPGHPEQGPYFLVKGLLKAVRAYKWDNGSIGLPRSLIAILALLCAQYQRRLPLHIRGVMSNDELFGGDPAFAEETLALIDEIVNELVERISAMDKDPGALKTQGELALSLLNLIFASAQINNKTAPLALNLYKIARKADQNSVKTVLEFAKNNTTVPLLKELGAKMAKI